MEDKRLKEKNVPRKLTAAEKEFLQERGVLDHPEHHGKPDESPMKLGPPKTNCWGDPAPLKF